MEKKFTISNEQAIVLYIVLQNKKLSGTKNRNRVKFIKLIENNVLDYEALRDDLQMTVSTEKDQIKVIEERKQLVAKIKDLSAESFEVVVEKDMFMKIKDIISDISENDELTGNESKIIFEIEEIFTSAVDVEE